VDLAALQMEITQTFINFSTFLDTLAPLPLQTNAMQPTATIMTSISMDNDAVTCLVGCQQPTAGNSNDALNHSIQHQPVDLLALQHELQQFTDDMQDFFTSLHASPSALACSSNHNNSSG